MTDTSPQPRDAPIALPGTTAAVGPRRTGSGWVLFAGIMIALVGVLNVIYGIAAIGDSRFFIDDATYILSGLNTWGWILLILGATQFVAAYSIWKGGESRPMVRHRRGVAQRDRSADVDLGISLLVARGVHARHPRHLRPGGVRRRSAHRRVTTTRPRRNEAASGAD